MGETLTPEPAATGAYITAPLAPVVAGAPAIVPADSAGETLRPIPPVAAGADIAALLVPAAAGAPAVFTADSAGTTQPPMPLATIGTDVTTPHDSGGIDRYPRQLNGRTLPPMPPVTTGIDVAAPLVPALLGSPADVKANSARTTIPPMPAAITGTNVAVSRPRYCGGNDRCPLRLTADNTTTDASGRC